MIPSYFHDINAVLPDGKKRWADEFHDPAPHVVSLHDMSADYVRAKGQRNVAYSKWMAAFFVKKGNEFIPQIKPKQIIFQAVRVLAFKHSESNANDWWEKYQDATFRVFVQPETFYDKSGDHKQWYLLSPEDSYLVNRYEIEANGTKLEPRDFLGREKHLSADKRLRRARLVPVECCHHLRHETTGGELPSGL